METIKHLSTAHYGNNIKRLREILGVKQDVIAAEFDISQQAVSDLEKKAFISDEILEKVASILKVPVEVIKNFNDEAAVNVIANTFNEASFFSCYQPVFNQIDKFLDIFERLLKTEQEKNALFEKMLQK
ncbi:MAG: helix-turn-helix transcriptional regulator [Prevotellaceae bacterium]|jgi:transcriptional regulator with XRE-family HTH domain|nr:helix-turn-helix transcriptional regulator [Prevotellaceae bacterium]